MPRFAIPPGRIGPQCSGGPAAWRGWSFWSVRCESQGLARSGADL